MDFLSKMERKFGKYAVRNLSFWLVLCFAAGYFLVAFLPDVYVKLCFLPYEIVVKHQYWRLFTWVISPPEDLRLLSLLMLFFYYIFGQALERAIGTFMFNIYILGGWFLNTVICLGVCIFKYYSLGSSAFVWWAAFNPGIEMMQFMLDSLMLGFALVYADSMMLLFFVIPMKAKWFAYIDMAFLAYSFVSTEIFISRVSIIAYLVNFFILYLLVRMASSRKYASKSQRRVQASYNKVVDFESSRQARQRQSRTAPLERSTQGPRPLARHKCAVCGRSEADNPDLEFRFCSKCNGDYEYCSEHLYTHEHVK